MPNAIIFDIETTGKDNPVLAEAVWVAFDSISPFTIGKVSSTLQPRQAYQPIAVIRL
jgi:hypothetical protein